MSRLSALLDSRAARLARYAVSLALIAWFARGVDWAALAGTRGQFDAAPAALALLLAGLTYPLHAWRWLLLLRAQGLVLSFSWAHAVTWIGQFYNSFLLGGLGGDAARAFYVCRDEPGKKTGGLAAIFLDRATGFVVLMTIAVIAMVAQLGLVASQPGLRRLGWGAAALLICAGAAVVGLRLSLARLPSLLAKFFGEENTAAIFAALNRTAGARREHLLALAVSFGIWLLDFTAAWLLARSVGLPVPFLEMCVAMAVAYAATALPISVGGHGVREGAMLATLGLFGLVPATGPGHDRGLLLALLVWAVTVLWSLVGGLVLLGARRLVPSR